MSNLKLGASIEVPELPGRWSVWSQSDETPGAFFVVPADDASRAVGAKFAVIKTKMPRGAARPVITLVRTSVESEVAR